MYALPLNCRFLTICNSAICSSLTRSAIKNFTFFWLRPFTWNDTFTGMFAKFVLLNLLLHFLHGAGLNAQTGNKIPDYDLSAPDNRTVLPPALYEISGITEINNSDIACVQDENGVIFIYSLTENKILKEIFFGYNGDYEGITRVGTTMYVLRSDGVIYEVPEFETGKQSTVYHDTGIPASNNEGLCYDEKNNRLLIACKGRVNGKDKNVRLIYAFNLQTKKLDHRPVYEFNVSAVTDFAIRHNILPPLNKNKKGKDVKPQLKLGLSGIAIHPLTKKIFLLSDPDRMLLIFEPGGKLEYLVSLDPELFNKPEGICFLANGDLLISNEGDGKQPSLLRFRYRGD
jgi:uncharacterized protein YjiK